MLLNLDLIDRNERRKIVTAIVSYDTNDSTYIVIRVVLIVIRMLTR